MKDIELFNDHFQNYKVYGIPKAQHIIELRVRPIVMNAEYIG